MQRYDDLSREALVEILKRRDRERRLGLVWERNEIEADHAVNSDFVFLSQDEALSIGGPSKNLVIEGDNFDALRWLRVTHWGKIKFIYIDPPYNSGARDFIYNDNYVDPKDYFRHSKWIEFMFQRLKLARDLLTPDGLIFVSIDDNELAHLRLLMDIVFPKQFQACLVWQTDGNSDNEGAFKFRHEYILVYAMDKNELLPPPVIDPNIDESSKLFKEEIRNTIVKNTSHIKNPPSDLLLPAGFPASFGEGEIPAEVEKWPQHTQPIVVRDWQVVEDVTVRSGWSSKTLCERFIAQEFAPVLDDRNQPTIFKLSQTCQIDAIKVRTSDQSYVQTVIKNVGSVQKTKANLKKIGIKFDYPKPVGLIEYLLQMVRGNDFIALDFFAGTGTTGEAVMQLNERDGGSRSFILASSTEATVDEPDKNICRDACARRLAHFFKTNGAAIKRSHPDLYGFTYARVVRVAAADAVETLTPEVLWLWIQHLHETPARPYQDDNTIQVIETPENRIAYLDRVTSDGVRGIAALAEGAPLIVYSWAPGRFREALLGKTAELRAIPDYFSEQFSR